eukprot:COSAG02_NODE_2300_length_9188_cov_57.987787_6_plen_1400_part_00
MAEARALLSKGAISAATKVWTDGMDDWLPLGGCAQLFGLGDALGGSEGEPPVEFHSLHYTYDDEDGESAQSDEISVSDAKALLEAGAISSATKVWTDGMDDWLPLAECAARFGLAAVLPEGTPPASASAATSAATSPSTVHYTLSDDPSDEQPEVPVAELQALIDAGTVGAEAKLWIEGWDEWLPLGDCAEKLGVTLAGGASAPTSYSRPLHLHIDRAAGLAAADTWGKSDPYVIFVFNGVTLGSTRVVWKDLDPVWDERRQLPPLRTGAQNQLILTVYDKDDGVSRGDFLGQVSIDLDDPASIGTVQTCELAPMAKEDARFNKFVAGKLTFSIEYDQVCSVYLAVKDTKLRHACDVKSAIVGTIKEGALVEALEERRLQTSARIRTAFGWATAKNLKTEVENLTKMDAVVDFVQTEGCTCAWLGAKAHPRQPWTRYWFELRGGELTYFRSNIQGKGTDRQGVISLHSCRGVAESPQSGLVLDLNCAVKTWSLRASKVEDREALLAALSAAIESAGTTGRRGVTFDGGDVDEECDDEWRLSCKCDVLALSSQADPPEFRNLWLSLENGSLKITANKENPAFIFDVDEDSIRAGFEKKRDSEDSTREFQFKSGSVTYLVRVATAALVDQWCDALRSVFHKTLKTHYHEGRVHQISPQDAVVHLSISVDDSMLKMYDGHGYSVAVRLAKCHSLRRGFQSTRTDDPREFSLVHEEDDGEPVAFEFRAGSAASRECWFTVLRRELARVAQHSASNPVHKLNDLMLSAATSAPLLDEDIHCVLFNQPDDDGCEVESVALAATEAACTVYLPVEEDVGSHGRVMLIPFTPVAKTLRIDTPVMQIQEELVKEYVQPRMDPGTPGGTPGKACRWALFMHRQLGLPPLRCTDTDSLADIEEFMWQVGHSIQPRLVLADLASQEEKLRLQRIMISTQSTAATQEFPELRPFTSQMKAIALMVQQDAVVDNRVAMQQRYLLAAHNEGSWANTGGTVQKSMINLTTKATTAAGGAISEDEVVFQGWLMKKGGSGAGDQKTSHMFKRRNWKTRCVTVSAKQLMYYDSEEAAEKGPAFAKGGMFFEGASMEIFDADDERKRRYQFYLKGRTVDGSYAGTRDLVMCAQSAAEYVEWEKLFLMHIAKANGGEVALADSAAAAQQFEVAVGTALEPEAEPFVMECHAESTVQNVLEAWLESKPAEWKAEHGATIESTAVYRRALGEVLQHTDILVDYDFVHLALSTHTGPQTLRIELTMQVDQDYSEAAAGAAPAPTEDPALKFRLHDLCWLRPSHRLAVDQSSAHTDTQDEVTEELAAIVERLRRDPLLDVEGDLKGMVWNHRGEFCAHPSMLAKVVQSVPSWSNPSDLRNLDQVVRTWAKPSPEEALQLLDPRFWEGLMTDNSGGELTSPFRLL